MDLKLVSRIWKAAQEYGKDFDRNFEVKYLESKRSLKRELAELQDHGQSEEDAFKTLMMNRIAKAEAFIAIAFDIINKARR